MKKYLVRFAVALLTFSIGVAVSEISTKIHRLARWGSVQTKIQGEVRHEETSVPAQPAFTMPRTLSPYNIATFINENPQANLTKLWQRLGIPKESERGGVGLAECGNCRAETLEYELDGELGDEVLLRIADPVAEAFRYLVFQSTKEGERWRLLGHVDAWGKYKEASHMILLSGGRPWLVIRDQGASGSGVALYLDRVFQVTPSGLKELVSYSAEGHQSGAPDGPDRDFSARVVSCDISHGQATVEIDFTVEYSIWDRNRRNPIRLFRKDQRATLVRRMPSKASVLDENRSDLSKHELDAVYNIDSLYDDDFLKYNYKELTQIATAQSAEKREWLRNYLKTCENTLEHRRLVQMLTQ